MAEHSAGRVAGFTSNKLPVELVWSQEFVTRLEALESEAQIKGWSRAKKLALIRGDWDLMSALAKSKSGPSTSSGRTVERDFVEEQTLHGTITAPGRADKTLAEATGLSRERIKALMAEGAVVLGGASVTSPSAKVQAGAQFTITLPPAVPAEAQPENIPLDVVFEDDHLIVVNKPAGMVVHPAAGNYTGTLVNALLHHCKGQLSGIGGVARPGIVHRIDKDTSGLLVAAKTTPAHEGLAAQFADHSISRRYLAVVNGHPAPPSGTIDERIGRSDRNRKKMAVLEKNSSRGKHAITHYKTLKMLDNYALVECRLETGRTHQIRVHMSSIGHPLIGDQVYGRTHAKLRPFLDRIGFHRQALHAADLGFDHPVNCNRIELSAELPADMQELIDETDGLNR